MKILQQWYLRIILERILNSLLNSRYVFVIFWNTSVKKRKKRPLASIEATSGASWKQNTIETGTVYESGEHVLPDPMWIRSIRCFWWWKPLFKVKWAIFHLFYFKDEMDLKNLPGSLMQGLATWDHLQHITVGKQIFCLFSCMYYRKY